MTINRPRLPKPLALSLLAASLFGAALPAHADEREDLERLRATVLGLIDTLVKNGVLPRAKVNAMMQEAEGAAAARLAQMPAEAGPDGKKIVRVPYVPESVKNQIRDQVKAEVLAQTRAEPGADAAAPAAPRIRFEGDVRVRAEATRLGKDNTQPDAYDAATPLTRAPDLLALGGQNKDLHTANTRESTERTRVRARLGVNVALSDDVSATIGIATGSTTGPTSTNQTLGQNGFFNKSSVVLDRASVAWKPASWFNANAGRFRNPFFGTDLLWADDLNFEGASLTLRPQDAYGNALFLTGGWFPLSPSVPNQSRGRSLLALQGGVDWPFGQKDNRFKAALGLFDYHGIEGKQETDATRRTVPDYVVRSEYGPTYRQRGNTLFRINAPLTVDSATNWGLASGFRELDLTASVDVVPFDPMHVVLTADVVKNLQFKRGDIATRTGRAIQDGKGYGYQVRLTAGMPLVAKAGDWNAYLGYRYLGSDAVLDAFTSSDFGLGGTNNKGYVVGANFGVARNTWLNARWMSSDLIDSATPAQTPAAPKSKFSVDLLQIDLNTRF
jgi:hypothetical protein